MKYQPAKKLLSLITSRGIFGYVIFFSLGTLCLAVYFFISQSNWLKKEFEKQVHTIEVKNQFAQQTIYIQNAELFNNKYAISGDSEINKTFNATVDSVIAANLRLRNLQIRKENENDSALFVRSDILMQQKIAFMQQVKRLCDDRNKVAALALMATNAGLSLSDSILAINDKINYNLEAQLKRSQHDFLNVNNANNLLALLGIIASMLLVTVALYYSLKLGKDVQRLNAELESRVVKRTRQLETANKELEAFSYSVSHDLRAPLRAISGYSVILQEDYGHKLDAEANKLINIVIESGKHMGQLIDDLLKFSQLGRLTTIQSDVDMNRIITTTISELSIIKDIGKYDIVLHPIPRCNGDANMLKQVWFNLVDNALKYSGTKEKPVIEIGCEENQKELTYFVKDNGVGFDMAYADNLFGVFQRLHRKEEFEGTGLGLSLVKRIIDKHRGRVFAVSVLYTGSTFYFTIPKNSL